MTTTIRTAFLILFLGILTGLQAQDKYEFAVVKYAAPPYNEKGIHVSISGKEYQKIEIKKDQVTLSNYDFTVVLNYVQKMNEEGWVVINTISSTQEGILTFLLQRKTN